MKAKKDINNINTQNRFLTACVCSILLLLTLCYFGVNSNFKGTSAVATNGTSCPASAPVEVTDAGGITYCCPDNSYGITDINGTKYCQKQELIDSGAQIGLNSDGVTSCIASGTMKSSISSTPANVCATLGDSWEPYSPIVSEDDCSIDSNAIKTCTCVAPVSTCGVYAREAEKFCYVNSNGLRKWMTYGEANSDLDTWTVAEDYKTETSCTNSNYTLNFDAGSGSLVSADDKVVKTENKKCDPVSDGSCKVSVPEVVSSNGKSFIGWTDSGSCSDAKMIDSKVSVTENKTYTACWSDEPFMLYNSSDSVISLSEQSFKDKIYFNINLDIYESDYDINPKCYSSDEEIATCRFNDDEFEDEQDTIELVINRDKKGIAFIQIYNYYVYEGNGTSTIDIDDGYVSIMVTDVEGGGSVTPTTYKVSYDGNEGTVLGSSSETVESGTIVRLPNASRDGYTLDGWYTAATGGTKVGNVGAEYTVTATTTLYAQWTKINNQKTVTYDGNEGTVIGSSSETVEYGTEVTLPNATRTGYTLDGWYTAATGGTKVGNVGAEYTVTATTTLYAHWTKINNQYIVTFNPTGGSVSPTSITVTNGDYYPELPVPTKTGYEFDGWFTEATGGSRILKHMKIELTNNLTLFAHWKEVSVAPTTYTHYVAFINDGKQIATASCQATTENGPCYVDVPKSLFEKTGHTLKGVCHPNLNGECYYGDEVVTYTANYAQYHALWEADVYTVNYYTNGGTGGPSSQTFKYGEGVVLSSKEPTKTNYKFNGWAISADATNATYSGGQYYSEPKDLYLYAVWVKESNDQITNTVSIPTSNLCKSNLVYNGLPQQLISSTSAIGYTLTGVNQTNVGDYTITARLASGYKWSDNTTGTKSFTCSIKRANPILGVDKSQVIMNVGEYETITYTYNGDNNKYSCSSNNFKIATCDLSSGKLVITGVSEGFAEVTLSVAATNNYNYVEKKISVTVLKTGNPTPESKTFTAIFNANGGTLNGSSSQSCTTTGSSCEITSLPTATRTGYTFKGWGENSSCSSGATNKLTLDKNSIYYACFVKDKTPTVDNDGNTTGNPTTGDITIALVWFGGMLAIGYAAWYFKRSKEN